MISNNYTICCMVKKKLLTLKFKLEEFPFLFTSSKKTDIAPDNTSFEVDNSVGNKGTDSFTGSRVASTNCNATTWTQ